MSLYCHIALQVTVITFQYQHVFRQGMANATGAVSGQVCDASLAGYVSTADESAGYHQIPPPEASDTGVLCKTHGDVHNRSKGLVCTVS